MRIKVIRLSTKSTLMRTRGNELSLTPDEQLSRAREMVFGDAYQASKALITGNVEYSPGGISLDEVVLYALGVQRHHVQPHLFGQIGGALRQERVALLAADIVVRRLWAPTSSNISP